LRKFQETQPYLVIEQLHSNLGTIVTIWVNWKIFIQICIYIFGQIATAQMKFGPIETTSFKFG